MKKIYSSLCQTDEESVRRGVSSNAALQAKQTKHSYVPHVPSTNDFLYDDEGDDAEYPDEMAFGD